MVHGAGAENDETNGGGDEQEGCSGQDGFGMEDNAAIQRRRADIDRLGQADGGRVCPLLEAELALPVRVEWVEVRGSRFVVVFAESEASAERQLARVQVPTRRRG